MRKCRLDFAIGLQRQEVDMSMYNEPGGHNAHLGDAYDAQSATELAAVYDRWSDNYDDYMDSVGYRHPEIC